MARRLSEKQKDKIINFFVEGKTIDELSKEFNCTKSTITRNLKKKLGEQEFKKLNSSVRLNEEVIEQKNDLGNIKFKRNSKNEKPLINKNKSVDIDDELFTSGPFIEIAPLSYEIENVPQKDLSSVPITEVDFPTKVFMIVENKMELQTKYLKEYPEWQFLSEAELERKTIEIFNDIKIAKTFCSKEQKVIKVPNPNVFKIVAPILISKGISRIVSEDKLISL